MAGKRRSKGVHQGSKANKLRPGTDTAVRLLQDVRAHRLDPTTLTAKQRRACLMLLANGSQTSSELAELFGVRPGTIRADLKKIRDELGREVAEWTPAQVVGQLSMVAEKTTAMAMRQQDPGLAWTIQRDFAKMLREFGVVGQDQQQQGFEMVIRSIGDGYERAKAAMAGALDPRLTGIQAAPEQPQPLPAIPVRGTSKPAGGEDSPQEGGLESSPQGEPEAAEPQQGDE